MESTVSVAANDTFAMESVTAYVDLTHSSPGDLEIVLVSPAGTQSILTPGQRPDSVQAMERWKLTTVRNWGEAPNGSWTLRIADKRKGYAVPCLDVAEWSTNVGTSLAPVMLNCADFASYNLCANGAQGANFTSTFQSGITGISDPVLADANGVTPAQACCVCGGGATAWTIPNVFGSWRLAVYGHDPTYNPPTSPATSGMAGTKVVGFGSIIQLSAKLASIVVSLLLFYKARQIQKKKNDAAVGRS